MEKMLWCHACHNVTLEEDPKPKDIICYPVCDKCLAADQEMRKLLRTNKISHWDYKVYRIRLEDQLVRNRLEWLRYNKEVTAAPLKQLGLLEK